MSNQMINVSRAVLEKALRDAGLVRFHTDTHVAELRSLLDAPAEEQQWVSIEAFNRVSTELEELKAAQPQGEPVAWVTKDGEIDWYEKDVQILPPGTKLYAVQPAPAAVVPDA